MSSSMRDTLEVLLAADLDAADRDAVAGYVKRSQELRSWLDSFQVRCVRRTDELAVQGRSEPADSLVTHEGSQSSRDSGQVRQRAVVCDLFVLFEAALAAGGIAAGHLDALASAIRDLNDEQRFGLIDGEERLMVTARTMRVDSEPDDSTGPDIPTATPAHRPVTANCPDASATVPEICVVTTIDMILDDCCNHGICETSDGRPIPAESLRRMLCDALVYPVVLGGNGEVLDSGRAERTVNRKQRRALRAMHRGCAHPGCTVGFDSCRIHHVRWWTRHRGPTDIDNLLPLCETHHHLVHEGRWTLTMTPDRIATWTRPDGTHWTTINTADRGTDIRAHAHAHPPGGDR